MKKTTFKDKKDTDLVKLLAEKREALRSFGFALAGSKSKNVKEGAGIRKEIARLLTEIRSRKA